MMRCQTIANVLQPLPAIISTASAPSCATVQLTENYHHISALPPGLRDVTWQNVIDNISQQTNARKTTHHFSHRGYTLTVH